MKARIQSLCRSDIRMGADKLHELLDGRVIIPDWLGVLLVGVGGALLPPLILFLITKGGLP